MRLSAFGTTDVGRKRTGNEDTYLVDPDLGLFMVADGMGGHAAGETASRMAVETVLERLREERDGRPGPFLDADPLESSPLPRLMRGAVEAANRRVHQAAEADPALAGMGTTLSALLLAPGPEADFVHGIVAHVGDSRVYLVRGEVLQQITEDHSLVNEQVKAGVLTPEEARQSRLKNVITRSVGFEEDVAVDLTGVRAQPGDVFVVCSDGLSNYLEAGDLEGLVGQHPLEQLPGILVDLANGRGGDDNVTVVAVRVDEA